MKFGVLILVFTLLIPSSVALGFLSKIPDDIDTVFISDFELSFTTWDEDGEVLVERDDISFYMKDKLGGGYVFRTKETGNRDVFISVEISYQFIDPLSIGTLASENGMLIYWSLTPDYFYINYTLPAMADEEFKISGRSAFKYGLDYGWRSRFRSFVHGDSIRIDVKCDEQTPNVHIDIPKNIEYYGKNISVTGRGIVVKYKVDTWMGDFKYPITDGRGADVWFEVRDIDDAKLQLVVHFTQGKSGDLYIVLNPVWYDYVTWVGMLDLFGWTEPAGSLEVI